jgi:hypothetical protein
MKKISWEELEEDFDAEKHLCFILFFYFFSVPYIIILFSNYNKCYIVAYIDFFWGFSF